MTRTDKQGSESCPRPKGPPLCTRSSSIRRQYRFDSFHLSSSTCLNQTRLPLCSRPTPTAHSPDLPRRWTSYPPSNRPRLVEETATLDHPALASWMIPPRSGLDKTGSLLLVLCSLPSTDGTVSNWTRSLNVETLPTMSLLEVDPQVEIFDPSRKTMAPDLLIPDRPVKAVSDSVSMLPFLPCSTTRAGPVWSIPPWHLLSTTLISLRRPT
jgi:hypothetical protein